MGMVYCCTSEDKNSSHNFQKYYYSDLITEETQIHHKSDAPPSEDSNKFKNVENHSNMVDQNEIMFNSSD
jgi:hypothetical protein